MKLVMLLYFVLIMTALVCSKYSILTYVFYVYLSWVFTVV